MDPLLTHLSIVGSLLFFFATRRLSDRLFAAGRLPRRADTAGYVRYMQDLLVEGLLARPRERRGGGAGRVS